MSRNSNSHSASDQNEAASSRLVTGSTRRTNRRTIVKAATKLVYAAPLVIASIKLKTDQTEAQGISGIRP